MAAHGSAGAPVTSLLPQLTGHPVLQDRVFVPAEPGALADADLLFTALPHGESAKLAAALPAELKVVDLSADFRLADPDAWERYYPPPHPGPLDLRAARAARRPGRHQGVGHGGRTRLLRHRRDPRPGPAAHRRPRRAVRHRDRGRLRHVGRGPLAPA